LSASTSRAKAMTAGCRDHARTALKGWIAVLIAALIFASGGVAIAAPDTPTWQSGQTFADCPDCPEMVVVPAGSFAMGSSDAETIRDLEAVPWLSGSMAHRSFSYEHPQHSVTIDRPIALGKYPVTRGEFAVFVREAGYSPDGPCTTYVNHKYPTPTGSGWQNPGFVQTVRDPVVCVSWHDVQAYIAWLNGKLHGRTSPNQRAHTACRARLNGNMPRVPAHKAGAGGVRPSVRITRFATAAAASGTTNKQRRSAASAPIRLGSTTWWAASGN
jgi:formylglycine-generating enzyme required for sulfatase activity